MSNYRFSKKIYIELFALVLSLRNRQFQVTRTSSEEFNVRLGHGLFRKLVSNAVLGGTFKEDEDLGRSAPFFILSKHEKDFYTYFIKHDCF